MKRFALLIAVLGVCAVSARAEHGGAFRYANGDPRLLLLMEPYVRSPEYNWLIIESIHPIPLTLLKPLPDLDEATLPEPDPAQTCRDFMLEGVAGACAGGTATPFFVSEAGQNSTTSLVALGTAGGGNLPSTTCPSHAYCMPFTENSLSGNIGIMPCLYANGGTAITTTVADDKSDSWTVDGNSSASANQLMTLAYFPNLPSGAHLVDTTFGTTAATGVNCDVAQFGNVATSSPKDTSATQVGTSSTTMTGPTLATTANDLVYAMFCRTGTALMASGSFNVGSGFTFGVFKYQDGCASEWEVSPGGNVTPTMTMGDASTYIVYAIALKAAPSAGAGTQPTPPYVSRFASWSTCGGSGQCSGTVSASTWKFQFPNNAGDLLVMTEAGASNYAANSITDSGSNTWALNEQCLQSGACTNAGGYASILSSQQAAANVTNTQTVNFTGTGDATINFYAVVGAGEFVNGALEGSNATTTTLMPATAFSFTPWATGYVTFFAGPIAFNTGFGVASPGTKYSDGGFFGGETISGGSTPASIIGQNNIWSHSYVTSPGAQNYQWTPSVTTSFSNLVGGVLAAFTTTPDIGIANTVPGNGSSGTSTTFTVPLPDVGNLLVVSPGVYDGSTNRTISKVCTGNSATCATGTQFSQVTGAASTAVSAEFGTDIWYLASAPASVTQITIVFSGTTSGWDYVYEELQGLGTGSWTVDPSGGGGHVNNGTSCSATCTGAAITTVGTLDFCIGHIETSGTGVTANPESGNAFIYPGTLATNFTSGGAVAALLTKTAATQTPVWTTAAGTFNESTACFNY